jgi:hypothetical protein
VGGVRLRIERPNGIITYEWRDGEIRRTDSGGTAAAFTWQLRRCAPRWTVETMTGGPPLVWFRVDPAVTEVAPTEATVGLTSYAAACRVGGGQEVPL